MDACGAAIELEEDPHERRRRLDKERKRRKRSEEASPELHRRVEKERARRTKQMAEDTLPERQQQLEKGRKQKATVKHASASPNRQARQTQAREKSQRKSDVARHQTETTLDALGEQALTSRDFTEAEIQFMNRGQRFTNGPRLALAFYYCCGGDPNGFGFRDEQLNGSGGEGALGRLEDIFDYYPIPTDLATCQNLVSALEADSTDIWAWASCRRVLLENEVGYKNVFRSLGDLRAQFGLAELERKRRFESTSEDIPESAEQDWRVPPQGAEYGPPPVIPIKRGCSPMVEWQENAKMLAGAFPELFGRDPVLYHLGR
ncbi:hypothetical protein PHYPSEUDO_006621 [Phytophthora pseudosyringae]|uniref:Uncharacterized protein n=1 Tax=Phytophthora pseudosyringae TaxID=221518 RepID=A0A8T1WGN1_9STRA|nr:hypothetical protein PHYPSEUDO_006621 [Phytophthora pseudosyringae]